MQPGYPYPPQAGPPGYPPQPGYPPNAYPPQQGYPPQAYPPGGPGAMPMMPVPAAVYPMPGAVMPNPAIIVQSGPPVAHDVLSTLALLPGLFIKQETRLMEALGVCEQSNRYMVEAWSPTNGSAQPSQGRLHKGMPIFRIKERSNFCARQLCYNRRAFNMSLFAVDARIPSAGQSAADPFTSPDAILLERPFRCTLACAWRPIVRVRHPTLGYLGEIYNPWKCLDYVFDIRTPTPMDEPNGPVSEYAKSKGPAGTVLYRIKGELCQWGMLFPPLPFGDCSRVVFSIHAASDEGMTRPIGSIQKIWSGCLKEMFTESDNYTVAFPADADPMAKALITSCAMLIDFMLFEDNGDKNNGTGSVLDIVA